MKLGMLWAAAAGALLAGTCLAETISLGDGVAVRLHLSTVDGAAVPVDFPLGADRSAVSAEVTGCSPGCRLVSLEVVAPPVVRLAGLTVEIFGLTAGAEPVLDPATDLLRGALHLLGVIESQRHSPDVRFVDGAPHLQRDRTAELGREATGLLG